MKFEIQTALSRGDCASALVLSSQLYASAYTDNSIRMLHASALGCQAGIDFYEVLDELVQGPLDINGIWRTFVRTFPSTSSDSRLASALGAIDVLHSVINPGVVVSTADSFGASTKNPGSAKYQDRTDEANAYLIYISMAVIGASLNRYGAPVSGTYAQGSALPWLTNANVSADTTGNACGLASAVLNMLDGITAVSGSIPGNVGTSLSNVLSIINTPLTTAINLKCVVVDGFSASVCNAAQDRIRYRSSCSESAAIVSVATAILAFVESQWL